MAFVFPWRWLIWNNAAARLAAAGVAAAAAVAAAGIATGTTNATGHLFEFRVTNLSLGVFLVAHTVLPFFLVSWFCFYA